MGRRRRFDCSGLPAPPHPEGFASCPYPLGTPQVTDVEDRAARPGEATNGPDSCRRRPRRPWTPRSISSRNRTSPVDWFRHSTCAIGPSFTDENNVALDQNPSARRRHARPPSRVIERARAEGVAAELEVSGVTKNPSRPGLEGFFVSEALSKLRRAGFAKG